MPSLITFAARRWRSRAFLLMIALTSPLTAAPAPASPTPPDFPDEAHVEQGCFISTFVYLRRFAAAHPAERALPITIRPRNFDEPHTVALVSWGGRWWGRDEDSGVFAINHSAGTGVISAIVIRRATLAFEKHSIASASRRGYNPKATRATVMTPARRHHDVAVAATLLPVATERFTLKSGRDEIPVLFFRPGPGLIAVYDPALGTATGESDSTNSAGLVASVGRLLGYQVDAVTHDFAAPASTTAPVAHFAAPSPR